MEQLHTHEHSHSIVNLGLASVHDDLVHDHIHVERLCEHHGTGEEPDAAEEGYLYKREEK